MPDRLSFKKTFRALEDAISITQKRQAVIAGNMSNLDTPGYRGKDVDFKRALARAVGTENDLQVIKTDSRHMDLARNGAEGVEPFEEVGEWNGYNWVSVDNEMMKLTQNNLIYRTSVETLLRKIAMLKEVLREGGK